MILNLTDYSSEPIHAQISRQMRARILDGTLAEGTGFEPRRFARRQRVPRGPRRLDDPAAGSWGLTTRPRERAAGSRGVTRPVHAA